MDKKIYIDCTNDSQKTEEMKTIYRFTVSRREMVIANASTSEATMSIEYYSTKEYAKFYMNKSFTNKVTEMAGDIYYYVSFKTHVNESHTEGEIQVHLQKSIVTYTYRIEELRFKEATITC